MVDALKSRCIKPALLQTVDRAVDGQVHFIRIGDWNKRLFFQSSGTPVPEECHCIIQVHGRGRIACAPPVKYTKTDDPRIGKSKSWFVTTRTADLLCRGQDAIKKQLFPQSDLIFRQ